MVDFFNTVTPKHTLVGGGYNHLGICVVLGNHMLTMSREF